MLSEAARLSGQSINLKNAVNAYLAGIRDV